MNPAKKTITFSKTSVWRTVILAYVFIVGFYILWLVPTLNDIAEGKRAFQLETAEKVEIDSEKIIIDHPKSRLNELVLFALLKLKGGATFDSLGSAEWESFLEDRPDVKEFFIVDLLGAEKTHIVNGRNSKTADLEDLSGKDYFIEAMRVGFSVKTVHPGDSAVPDMLAAKRFNVPELGNFIFGVKVDISKRLEGFSSGLKEKNNERVYIVDDQNRIIEHYDRTAIGVSVSGERLVKNTRAMSGAGKNRYQSGSYTTNVGEKLEATVFLFKPVDFLIVVEENYKEAWAVWNRLLLFSALGMFSILALVVLLTRNTLKMFDASSQLAKERDQIGAIIEHLDVGVVEYDDNFTITLINPKAEELLKIKKDEVLNKSINSEFMKGSSVAQSLAWVLYPSLAPNIKRIPVKEGESSMVELKIEGLHDLHLQIATMRIFDHPSKTYRYLKILRDVSREEAIARSKSEFISVAAHQLRTPLSAIKWVFRMLIEGDAGPVNSEQKEYLQRGYNSNERIIDLVGDMLDVARIEEGRFGFEFYYVDISDVIQKVIDAFDVKAREKNIKLVFEKFDLSFPPVKIDPARVGLALQNLIDNALKYTPKNGTIAVKVEAVDEYLQVTVADNGIGVPKNQMEKLFTKVFRGTNAVKQETDGSGLGLYIVKNIARRHGGDVWANSEEGKGTTFYLALPLKENEANQRDDKPFSEFVEGLSSHS